MPKLGKAPKIDPRLLAEVVQLGKELDGDALHFALEITALKDRLDHHAENGEEVEDIQQELETLLNDEYDLDDTVKDYKEARQDYVKAVKDHLKTFGNSWEPRLKFLDEAKKNLDTLDKATPIINKHATKIADDVSKIRNYGNLTSFDETDYSERMNTLGKLVKPRSNPLQKNRVFEDLGFEKLEKEPQRSSKKSYSGQPTKTKQYRAQHTPIDEKTHVLSLITGEELAPLTEAILEIIGDAVQKIREAPSRKFLVENGPDILKGALNKMKQTIKKAPGNAKSVIKALDNARQAGNKFLDPGKQIIVDISKTVAQATGKLINDIGKGLLKVISKHMKTLFSKEQQDKPKEKGMDDPSEAKAKQQATDGKTEAESSEPPEPRPH